MILQLSSGDRTSTAALTTDDQRLPPGDHVQEQQELIQGDIDGPEHVTFREFLLGTDIKDNSSFTKEFCDVNLGLQSEKRADHPLVTLKSVC